MFCPHAGPAPSPTFFPTPKPSSNDASPSRPQVPICIQKIIQGAATPPPLSTTPSLAPTPSTSPSPVLDPSPKPKPPAGKRKRLPGDLPASDPDLVPRDVKRLRPASASGKPRKRKASTSSEASSRGSSRSVHPEPSPEPLHRNSRSRSTSSFPIHSPDTSTFNRKWRTDEDGLPGMSHLSSELVVQGLIKSYKTYFRNPQDPNDRSYDIDPKDTSIYPVVELEYPNTNASERFILAAPKDKDHYNPIMDLEASLYTIIEFYCTKEQQSLFGPIPSDTLSETINSSSRSSSLSPSPSSPPLPSSPLQPSVASSEVSSCSTRPALLRTFKKALNCQDGPVFVTTLTHINTLLRSFKMDCIESNSLMQTPLQWTQIGFPRKLLMRIIEENYQRTVGPKVPTLRRYEAFSSTVYGELMPSLVDEIVRITNLREDSLFLDLGSGVGNVVVQASLQTGCKSFGVELMNAPAQVAITTKEQIEIRSRMWGVRIGEIELTKGDMLFCDRLNELMPKADVVLVDNKVFDESLNEALRPKFLDLKEGAIVISLAPFAKTTNTRVTERNVHDMSAIFEVTEREYQSGSVSWGSGGGSYYIHRVDRTGYAKMREEYEVRMRRGCRRRH